MSKFYADYCSYAGYELHDNVIHIPSGMHGRVVDVNSVIGYITIVWEDATLSRHGNRQLPISNISLLV